MIEVTNYKQFYKGKVIGYVDIRLPNWGISFKRIAHLQNENKKWFNFANYYEEQPDGSKKYFPYISFDAEMNSTKFFEQLSEAVKTYCDKNKIKEQKAVNFDEECPF